MKPIPTLLRRRQPRARHPHPQQGVALVVALILLVVMTLLGLSAMRSVTLEEKMAANTFDRSVSFQAAESVLREAESKLTGPTPPVRVSPSPTAAADPALTLNDCAGGLCVAHAPGATKPRWFDDTFTQWQAGTSVVSGSITVPTDYFIEYLGAAFPCSPDNINSPATCKRYRVTARSNPGNDRAVVMLQSVYATP
jgi:type IV pilus assembly protein PilX